MAWRQQQTYAQWMKAHEDDIRILLPKVQQQLRARESFGINKGKGAAAQMLAAANAKKDSAERRARAVLLGLAEVQAKLDNDHRYRPEQAAKDVRTLRAEWDRLDQELIRCALAVEDARAIDADPLTWAENDLLRFPELATRVPPLPDF